ncbi:hypothetical protein WMF45_12450 [Sorangium sp. So ce448]|uniref:hypothetical protein n=1 Tax=Sorangium sp. So ce448 TaxID=3133314 RepID=UPI003F632C0C
MKRTIMNVNAINWLRGKYEGDQMGKLQCRYQAGGQWSQSPRPTDTDGEEPANPTGGEPGDY